MSANQRRERRPQVIRHKTNGQLNEGENEHSENTRLLKLFHKEDCAAVYNISLCLLLIFPLSVCLPSPSRQMNIFLNYIE